MPVLLLGIFFVPLSLLVLFLLYKRVELSLGKELGISVFFRSQDEKIVKFLFSLRALLRSYKGRVSFFVLNIFVYPLHKLSRRTKFKINSFYFRFLERLRQRHMARYNINDTSLYLKSVSSGEVDEEKDKEKELKNREREFGHSE